jgi:hypothetical protein
VVRADAAAVLHTQGAPAASPVWFDTRCGGDALAPGAPAPEDAEVPAGLRASLSPIAQEWTAGVATDRARAEAIERRLRREYAYSLVAARDPRQDPVLDFLRTHREGHCEYFATAMTLLARTSGVPARMVGGFRVAERNAIGGWYVVREKNAHAWVEAYVDGAWRTFDPTPPAAIEANAPRETGALGALGDVARVAWTRVVDAASALGLRGVLALLVVAAVALFGLRALRRRRERVQSAGDARSAARPLPAYEALARALADHGHARPTAEPLERFADRLAALPDAWARDASAVVTEYARLRYGGEGDEGAIVRRMQAVARRVGAQGLGRG